MTTAAMVLGAMPLALSTGAGAEGSESNQLSDRWRHAMGTLFALLVIPITYTVLVRSVRIVGEEEGMLPLGASGSALIAACHK